MGSGGGFVSMEVIDRVTSLARTVNAFAYARRSASFGFDMRVLSFRAYRTSCKKFLPLFFLYFNPLEIQKYLIDIVCIIIYFKILLVYGSASLPALRISTCVMAL